MKDKSLPGHFFRTVGSLPLEELKLTFFGPYLELESFGWLADLAPTMRHLSLYFQAHQDRKYLGLPDALRRLCLLESFDFCVQKEADTQLIRVLKSLPQLRALRLQACHTGQETSERLRDESVRAWVACPLNSLTELCLACVTWPPEGLATMLRSLRSLKTLSLDCPSMPDDTLAVLEDCPWIERVVIVRGYLTLAGVQAVLGRLDRTELVLTRRSMRPYSQDDDIKTMRAWQHPLLRL
jgi:hypothetical protein